MAIYYINDGIIVLYIIFCIFNIEIKNLEEINIR